MLNRPYIICHMVTSLDGKVIGDYLEDPSAQYFTDEYENIHGRYKAKAWMCGRVTMEEHFTFGHKLDLDEENAPIIERTDYVATNEAETYAISVDPSGKLGWTENVIAPWNDNRTSDHIIQVLTERVSDGYLAHLREIGISYIFGGKETIQFSVVVKKLKDMFAIDKLMLEGGGFLNGSLLNEGLIDELSLILVPMADGATDSVTLFEISPYLTKQKPVHFALQSVDKLGDDGLWLNYKVKRE